MARLALLFFGAHVVIVNIPTFGLPIEYLGYTLFYEQNETYMFLFGLSKIVCQKDSVTFVDLCGDFIESCNESMFDPIDQKLDAHYH